MTEITNDDFKRLRKNMEIARDDIQKTLVDLGKGGINLTAVYIILLEALEMTERKMRESGTTDTGLANCKKIAHIELEN
jgi:hypothetical protein